MLGLVLDVMLDGTKVGGAYAKCPIALLPGEIDAVLANPSRRICLERLDGLRDRHGGRQRKYQVCVVGYAAGGQYRDLNPAADPVEVLPEFRLELFRDEIARSLVLNTTWMSTLVYLWAMVPSLRDS